MPSLVTEIAERFLLAAPGPKAEDARTQAGLLLLDTLGCGFAAIADPALTRLTASLAGGGDGPCGLIGRREAVRADIAVLLNGAAIRLHDLNDYTIRDGRLDGHPSDNIPVAIAGAQAFSRPGADLLDAIVLGYDLFGLARAMMADHGPWDGVSVSGLIAPAMFGRLMGLDSDRLAHALALSVARAATSTAVRAGAVSAAKSLANPMVAASGIIACELAAAGFTGPLDIFEQPQGARHLFAQADATREGVATIGAGRYIMDAQIKAYPCLATGQSLVAAGIALHGQISDPHKIARLAVRMADFPIVRRQQADEARSRPHSHESADHSFPFLAAVTVLDGALGSAQFADARWHDPAIVALMEKVEMTVDPALNAAAQGGYPCTVEAEDRDGHTFRVDILEPPGYSTGRLDADATIAKFRETAAAVLGPDRCSSIVDEVLALTEMPARIPRWPLLLGQSD